MDEKCAGYSIVLRHAPIPGIGGGLHTFWVLLDPRRHVIGELHGEAVNRKTGEIATFGDILRGDNQLKFYPRNYESHWSEEALPGGDRYFCGSSRDAKDRWNAASELGGLLNTKNIDYRAFDLNLFSDNYAANSNAMAFTLGRAMGFELRRLVEPPGEPYLLPGWLRDFAKEYPNVPSSSFPIEKPTHLQRVEVDTSDQVERHMAAQRMPELDPPLVTRSDTTRVTPVAARRAIAAAKADDAFGRRYVSNDRNAVDYMHALHRAAYPEMGSEGASLSEPGGNGRDALRRGPADGSAGAAPQVGSRSDLAPWQGETTAAARRALNDLKSDSSFVNRYLNGGRKEFDHLQGLMRAAYPEPNAADAGGAEERATGPAFKPWSPSLSSDGVAPWLRGAFTSEATRAPGVETDSELKLAPWMGYRKLDWLRDSGE